MNIKIRYTLCFLCIFFWSCVENDLPERVVVCGIEEMQVEGMVSCKITDESSTVTIKVIDTMDLHKIQVEKLVVTDMATIFPDSSACMDVSRFPDSSFESLDQLPEDANTFMDFSKPVLFRLSLYQDYKWTINVTRDINRSIKVKNQVGTALIDENTKQVVVYVDSVSQPSLRNVEILSMQLGSSIAKTEPEPSLVTDFTRPRVFFVSAFGEREKWTVSVQYPTANVQTTELSAWTRRAYLKGSTLTGNVSVEYRKKGEEMWESVLSNEMSYTEGEFLAMMTHLQPQTTYEYQMNIDGKSSDVAEFVTDSISQVPNLSFEDWIMDSKAWYPNIDMDDANHFWDSGNDGASIASRNPTSPETKEVIKGKAVRMASDYIDMASKFAAGNIYTGRFIQVTSDLRGAELDFGQKYESRPSGIKGYYKYTPGIINQVKPPFEGLLGQTDSCHIYMALFDWTGPFRVNTTKGIFVDLTWKNESMIAFGEMKTNQATDTYKAFNVQLQYRDYFKRPTYILIVASASKYGDYFTGSTSSVLLLDECELVFE